MKEIMFALVLVFFLSTAVKAQTPSPDLWERVLGWLGWEKQATLITRGSDFVAVKGLGNLWYVDLVDDTPAPVDLTEAIRSPIPDETLGILHALTEDSFISIDLGARKVIRRAGLPEQEIDIHLLRQRDGAIYAVSATGCVIAFDFIKWETRTCDLNESQVRDLVAYSRMCNGLSTGVRFESGPPSRADVFVRRGRLSQRLTAATDQRANFDPVFSQDCNLIYFISRDRI